MSIRDIRVVLVMPEQLVLIMDITSVLIYARQDALILIIVVVFFTLA